MGIVFKVTHGGVHDFYFILGGEHTKFLGTEFFFQFFQQNSVFSHGLLQCRQLAGCIFCIRHGLFQVLFQLADFSTPFQ